MIIRQIHNASFNNTADDNIWLEKYFHVQSNLASLVYLFIDIRQFCSLYVIVSSYLIHDCTSKVTIVFLRAQDVGLKWLTII